MGARRIKHHLREHLIELVHTAITDCTNQAGEIDTARLTEQVMASLPGQLDRAVIRELRDESVKIVIDSLTSDLLRDGRRRVTIAGKEIKLRNVYRIPRDPGAGTWTTKELEDLTEEDIDKLERYHHQQAMRGLLKAKAMRELRGFVHEPKAQFELPETVSVN